MARARNIKPGFYKNYKLADLGSHAQLLFAGLWGLADREGRLEDKPRLIKAEIFPYYDCDVNGELTKLEREGFVTRYVVDGLAVIQVLNFKKHQSPHHTEKASTLPAKPGGNPHEQVSSDIHGELTVSPLKSNHGNLPDSLIPDSLIPDSKTSTPNPAVAGPVARVRKTGVALQTFVDECKVKGERPLRDYAPLWNYVNAAGLSEDYVALAWAEFCRRFLPGGAQEAKRQKDWRCTFRKYVENNYFKLWAIDRSDQYFLTSQGKQAEKFQATKAHA